MQKPDFKRLIDDFPILARQVHGKRLVYLDSAATSQKPECVINALSSFYKTTNANIHRGIYSLSEESSNLYDELREKVAEFIGGVDSRGVIFTSNTTESLNLVARSWGTANIGEGDEILITEMEHHSNLLPWMILAREKRALIKYIPVTDDGLLDMNSFNKMLTERTKIVAVTMVSNVLGTINPVEEIIEASHRKNAVVVLDGAQGVPHLPVDAAALDCDFLAFSAHKMLGPTGIGVLYGKPEILETMDPFMVGGGMISEVTFDKAAWAEIPCRFEAGTPNFAAAPAFAAAIDYLKNIGMSNILSHEKELTQYALEKLSPLKNMRIFGPADVEKRTGVITWYDDFIHPHDLSTILDTEGIAVRAGHHCAQPLLIKYNVPATTRASFYIYNTKDDIDVLVDGLKKARKYLRYEN